MTAIEKFDNYLKMECDTNNLEELKNYLFTTYTLMRDGFTREEASIIGRVLGVGSRRSSQIVNPQLYFMASIGKINNLLQAVVDKLEEEEVDLPLSYYDMFDTLLECGIEPNTYAINCYHIIYNYCDEIDQVKKDLAEVRELLKTI